MRSVNVEHAVKWLFDEGMVAIGRGRPGYRDLRVPTCSFSADGALQYWMPYDLSPPAWVEWNSEHFFKHFESFFRGAGIEVSI